jgi:prolyl-tRNA synthetase
LQLIEVCTDDPECSRAAGEWRKRVESWARGLGVNLRGTEHGDDTLEVALGADGPLKLLACSMCGYAGIEESARFTRAPGVREAPLERQLIATPGAHTIDLLASTLHVERSRTLKAVFLTDDLGSLTFLVLPGDVEVSLWKVGRLTGGLGVRPATTEEIRAAGAEPGYASPIGLHVQGDSDPHGACVIVDSSIPKGSNYVAGANKDGYHFTGVNFPRDFAATRVEDIAQAIPGAGCVQCGHVLQAERGLAVARWQILASAITYADERGEHRQTRLGLGTVFLESALLAVIESAADARGVAWPLELAPFQVHLVDLKSIEASLEVETQLVAAGLEVLFDDRPVSAGVKFTDADLIGCPVRVTVGTRSLGKGGFEVSGRGGEGAKNVPREELLVELAKRLGATYVKLV